MNKTFGKAADFAYRKDDGTRTIVSYDFEAVAESDNATWREVYFPKNKTANPSVAQIKSAIIADINARTAEDILTGLLYADNDGTQRNVWLSAENQHNFAESHRKAVLQGNKNYEPVTFKIAEDENGDACYRTFDTLADLTEFIFAIDGHIAACLAAGYAEKDGMDWSVYEQPATAAEQSAAE